MAKRQKLWARRRRAELIKELGGECVKCGSKEKLTFDHINPATRTWKCMGTDYSQQIVNYLREHRMGLIQLLCDPCNTKKGDRVDDSAISKNP